MEHSLIEDFFKNLQRRYRKVYPASEKVEQILGNGKAIINDHVAFRTLNHPKVNIDRVAPYIINMGYEEKEHYLIESKHLKARHYEHVTGKYPRIFISELCLEDFSDDLQRYMEDIVAQIDDNYLQSEAIFYSGKLWDISYDTYRNILKESQYGAWFASMGYIANHFTINVNNLEGFKDLMEVNSLLKERGFALNSSDGEIKGSPELMLEQSSVIADDTPVTFSDTRKMVPGCYYEFALRYPDSDGKLFDGFIAGSANRIFESTDSRY